MNNKKQCPRCFHTFSSSQRLQSHLARQIPCQPEQILDHMPDYMLDQEEKTKKFICNHCQSRFTRKANLIKHQKNVCNSSMKEQFDLLQLQIEKLKENQEKLTENQVELREKPLLLEKQLAELKEKPSINNQILQVVCIGNNDNYLDMLTEKWDFNRALCFIKDCALSSLSGDCRLIEKIYLNDSQEQTPIRYVDKNRNQIEYYNEKKEKVKDSRESFGRKLANNLQNSYLKGVNYLINKNLENRGCPNKFLQEYDIQTWNAHIYELSDAKYQKKVINQLQIPGGT
jgi:hypothetical protein